ncbi:cytochrome P450 [Annulohypoxylon bovei var. microspora]|nr:cytochrome P450 [Annulohypoxylon bovei var. microspora]
MPFTIPSVERGIAVIIPPRQLRSVYGLPEDVVGVQAAQDQTLQVGWTIWDKRITDVRFHISVIRHQLTRNLKQLTPAIADELRRGFDQWWGTEKEWRELSIWDSCFKLVAGASNRAFCGARPQEMYAGCEGEAGEDSDAEGRSQLLLVNAMHNLILDLVSSDPAKGYVEALREECEQVIKEAGGSWTFEAINKLKLVDSAIRESIRFTPITSVGLPRTVVHPDGIQLENSDVKIPYGTTLATPMEAIHYDEEIYKNARQFDAFRFAHPEAVNKIFEAFHGQNFLTGEKAHLNNKPRSSLSLDDAFVGFGFGKHGCPGRYFALNEMKIFVAHMLLHYDLEFVKERPQLIDFLWLKLPFHGGKVRVRRRTAAPSPA